MRVRYQFHGDQGCQCRRRDLWIRHLLLQLLGKVDIEKFIMCLILHLAETPPIAKRRARVIALPGLIAVRQATD